MLISGDPRICSDRAMLIYIQDRSLWKYILVLSILEEARVVVTWSGCWAVWRFVGRLRFSEVLRGASFAAPPKAIPFWRGSRQRVAETLKGALEGFLEGPEAL